MQNNSIIQMISKLMGGQQGMNPMQLLNTINKSGNPMQAIMGLMSQSNPEMAKQFQALTGQFTPQQAKKQISDMISNGKIAPEKLTQFKEMFEGAGLGEQFSQISKELNIDESKLGNAQVPEQSPPSQTQPTSTKNRW